MQSGGDGKGTLRRYGDETEREGMSEAEQLSIGRLNRVMTLRVKE